MLRYSVVLLRTAALSFCSISWPVDSRFRFSLCLLVPLWIVALKRHFRIIMEFSIWKPFYFQYKSGIHTETYFCGDFAHDAIFNLLKYCNDLYSKVYFFISFIKGLCYLFINHIQKFLNNFFYIFKFFNEYLSKFYAIMMFFHSQKTIPLIKIHFFL